MEMRTLRYFLAVAKEGNMTRAANSLHVSQSTLSKAVASLEKELGQKLFTRHSFKVSLTAEGEMLRVRAQDVIDMADLIEHEFHSAGDNLGGEIRFGNSGIFRLDQLADAIAAFKKRHPHMRYSIITGEPTFIIKQLNKGLIDIAYVPKLPDLDQFSCGSHPRTLPWGVMVRRDNILAERAEIRVDDLRDVPLFCSPDVWDTLVAWAGKGAADLHMEGMFSAATTAAVFAKKGMGVPVVLEGMIPSDGDLVFRPLIPAVRTTLNLVWRKPENQTPLVREFVEYVEAHPSCFT